MNIRKQLHGDLTPFLHLLSLGVPMAEVHRQYMRQGQEYKLSLPVFTKLIKQEIKQ